MDSRFYNLELARIQEIQSRSRTNVYSDKAKENFYKTLSELVSQLADLNPVKIDKNEDSEFRNVFRFIYNSFTFLDDSTLNLTPFETVFCLREALSDWISKEELDSLIIVTSLSNENHRFSFDSASSEAFKVTKLFIEERFKLKFTHRLIRISLPRVLSRDQLACVVLYHELGHFVDVELNISNNLFYHEFTKPAQPSNEKEYKWLNHQREYFADLFAAQYVGESCSNYLEQINPSGGETLKHPSTFDRVQAVKSFTDGKAEERLNSIQDELSNLEPSKKLELRYECGPLVDSGFFHLVPQKCASKEELHGLFSLGWQAWLKGHEGFLRGFSNRQQYHIVNNLIEKSISNYIVEQKWPPNS